MSVLYNVEMTEEEFGALVRQVEKNAKFIAKIRRVDDKILGRILQVVPKYMNEKDKALEEAKKWFNNFIVC